MTSQYFNNFNNTAEQNLIADLITESIHIYGYDVFYMPRHSSALDPLYNEDSTSSYLSNYPIEMYIKNVEGFQGSQFLSMFDVQLRQQITLTVSIRTFTNTIGNAIGYVRPLEGDLIYFPLDSKVFVIKDVNKYSIFYQAGTLQVFDLQCEVFEYSSEKLATGIAFVDALETSLSLSTKKYGKMDANNNPILINGLPSFSNTFSLDTQTHDRYSSNEEISTAVPGIVDFSVDNPFSRTF